MIELSAKRGHQRAPIGELCARAGVSPVTFYELFGDKEGLLLAAYRSSAERIFSGMRAVLERGEGADVPKLALEAMLTAVAADPDGARIVFVEALGGGERVAAERKRAFERFEARIRQHLARRPPDAPLLDVPVVALAGALRHIVARSLRARSEHELPSLVGPGLAWLYCYARPAGAQQWSDSARALLDRPVLAPSPEWQPRRLPPGSHGLPAGVVARSQRTRLLLATAQVTMQRGYVEATVNEIVSAARVARPVFYEYFADKHEAFLEAQSYPTQFILERCAKAYFSATQWPARMWRMLEVLLGLIAASPAVSHLRLVECYAAGPEAIRRAEEITRSFTLFIEEGYHYTQRGNWVPQLASQAIAGAIFEIVQRQVARGETAEVPAHLPQLAYIALAPFLGADEAIQAVGEMASNDCGGRPRD